MISVVDAIQVDSPLDIPSTCNTPVEYTTANNNSGDVNNNNINNTKGDDLLKKDGMSPRSYYCSEWDMGQTIIKKVADLKREYINVNPEGVQPPRAYFVCAVISEFLESNGQEKVRMSWNIEWMFTHYGKQIYRDSNNGDVGRLICRCASNLETAANDGPAKYTILLSALEILFVLTREDEYSDEKQDIIKKAISVCQSHRYFVGNSRSFFSCEAVNKMIQSSFELSKGFKELQKVIDKSRKGCILQ